MADDQEMAWLAAVQQQLGLAVDVDEGQATSSLTQLAQLVQEKVDGALVARTLFLVGVAAGRAADPAVAARDYAEKLGTLAEGWDAEDERGEPANDQDARA